MGIKISQLTSGTSVNGDDQYPAVQGGATKKFAPAQMANYILNTFSSLSLGGAVRTVKAAIDAIAATVKSHSTLLGDSAMGTTATTVTGAIAEHESDITELNGNLTPTAENIITAASGFTLGMSWQYRSGNRHWGFLELTGTITAGTASTNVAQSSVLPAEGSNKFFIAEFTTSRWSTDIVMGNCFMPADGGFFVTTGTTKGCVKIWYDFMGK